MSHGQYYGIRRQVTATRATGTIVEWDSEGGLGWISPDVPVKHPTAFRHAGRIFLRESDLDADINRVGVSVTFFVYVDSMGLGAMNCRPSTGPGVAQTSLKPSVPVSAAHASSWSWDDFASASSESGNTGSAALPRQVLSNTPTLGRVQRVRGSTGWIDPLESLPAEVQDLMTRGQIYMHMNDVEGGHRVKEGEEVLFCVYMDAKGIGAMFVSPTEAGIVPPKFQPAAQPNPRGRHKHNRAETRDVRERLTTEKITGEVIEWRRTFGWIIADEEISHPQAHLHNGRIYVHKDDILDVPMLEPGQQVQFQLYSDSSGLGAEECMAWY